MSFKRNTLLCVYFCIFFLGTFIAVDQLLRLLSDRQLTTVDVFQHIYRLRKCRRHMVQTSAQYNYIYKCLAEHILAKSQTPVP